MGVVRNFLLERGAKPVKGGGCINGGLPLFLLLYNDIYCECGESKVLFITLQTLAMQDSDPSFYCTKTYHLHIFDPLWLCTKNVDCFI